LRAHVYIFMFKTLVVAVLGCFLITLPGFVSAFEGNNVTVVQPIGSESLPSGEVLMNSSECVGYLGYESNSFVFAYQMNHGSNWVHMADAVAHRKGLVLLKVDVGQLKDNGIRLLQCFLGKYKGEKKEFVRSPRVFCPKTGEIEQLYVGRSPMNQMRSFADKCI
jgi:hypothetical protein